MISFIIPAYNAEKTIERAIKSILEQEETSLEYEIIVVNDGSSDNLDEKMEQYQQNEKIKYFKKENGGLSDARNYGLTKSKGEYIIFVDSDDYISKSILSDIEPYIAQEIDLIKWSPIWVDENGNEILKPQIVSFEKVTGEQGFNLLFGKDNLIECAWSYAIKRELVPEFPIRNVS